MTTPKSAHYTRGATPGKSCTFQSPARLTGPSKLVMLPLTSPGKFAMIRVALFTLGFFAMASAQAQVYKCADASGNISYSQVPCPANTKREPISKGGIPPAPAAAPVEGAAGKDAKSGPTTPADREQAF